ncbi:MAG: family 10 glycosylhydrolase [Acidobacteriota bacterium]
MRRLAGLVALLALLPVAAPNGAPDPEEVRALWVVRTSLTTPASVVAMVDAARRAGFNTLLVQVRGRGDAFYRSQVEPRADSLAGQPDTFDPLALVLARAGDAGLKVHAWINANLVADAADLPVSERHLVRRHPEWLMLPRDLAVELQPVAPRSAAYVNRLASWTRWQSASVEGLYASPVHEGAVDHLDDVVRDIVSTYPVDGVHFDYVRYPGSHFDYSRGTLEAFKREVDRQAPRAERRALARALRTNALAYPDRYPDRWLAFRRSRLTVMMRRLRATVKAVRPEALVSAAVVPDEWTASGSRGQHWSEWLREGLLDVVCPMAYTSETGIFTEQVTQARHLAQRAQVWAGIGAYRLSPEQVVQHVDTARSVRADGIVLFSYDSLVHPPRGPDYLSRLGDAAFGR